MNPVQSDPVWVIGTGMTPFGIHPGATVKQLTGGAVREALDDAGAAPRHVEAAFFGNVAQGILEGQVSIGGQIALRPIGLEGIPIVNVENACATGATAFYMAVNQVRSGAADIALAVGVEKLNAADPAVLTAAFRGGTDVHDPDAVSRVLNELGGGPERDLGRRTVFMDVYAALARSHMRRFGTTRRQLAAVAAKNHAHAVANDKAHFRRAMSIEEILAARPLGYPLTVPMCAPMTDGAAAAVVCNSDGLRRLRGVRPDDAAPPVRVRGCALGTGVSRELADYERHIGRIIARRAYQQAGVEPGDVSVAEVHDAVSFGEILQTELLGFCPLGDGGKFAESGATTLGGALPVNPSGGLGSKGHPIGATGIGQIYELVAQLRGAAGDRQVTGARIGLAENGGGLYAGEEAVAVVTILEAEHGRH